MRMILIIAIAIGGFYFVNNNLREHGQATLVTQSGPLEIGDLWDSANTLFHDAAAEGADLYQRLSGKPLHLPDRAPQCGEADKHGNINYCFQSAKEVPHR